MRRRFGLVSVGGLVVGALLVWYGRPIVSVHRIGIPWRATLRHSHCTNFRHEDYCTTVWPPTVAPPYSASIRFRPLTRELLRADRTWILTDSSMWARLVDSTQRSLAEQGWQRLACDSDATHFPIADAWKLGAHEIRLYASPRMPVPRIGMRRYATVEFVAFGAMGCGPRYRTRLLTPAELARAARDWFAQQIGIQ